MTPPLRVLKPKAVYSPAADYRWNWTGLTDWLLMANGGNRDTGPIPEYQAAGAATKESEWKAAIRSTGYRGLSNLDIDAVFANRIGNATLAVSFKTGHEAPSNRWHLKAMRTALAVPLIEIRWENPEFPPQTGMYTGTWLTKIGD